MDAGLQGRIDQAILNARKCLLEACREEQKKSAAPRAESQEPQPGFGKYGLGEEALVGLALVQSGTRPSDPLLKRIWDDLRKGDLGIRIDKAGETYNTAVALMFVEAMMHAPCGEPWPSPGQRDGVLSWIKRKVEGLAEGCDGGAWTYGWGYGVGERKPSSYRVISDESKIGSEALIQAARPMGPYDHSNTQYAVLGLKAAALCGVMLESHEVLWRLVLQHFLSTQEPEGNGVTLRVIPERSGEPFDLPGEGWEEAETPGERCHEASPRGWSYLVTSPEELEALKKKGRHASHISSPTMTAAGLTALLVAQSEVRLEASERKLVETGVLDGLAWLQLNWSRNGLSPDRARCNGYLVYGLERLGVLCNLKTIGGHPWYAEGARALVSGQGKEGNWPTSTWWSPHADTAFCLLFLCRGTRPAYGQRYEVGERDPGKHK